MFDSKETAEKKPKGRIHRRRCFTPKNEIIISKQEKIKLLNAGKQ